MFLRHLTGFRISRTHGNLSESLPGISSNANACKIRSYRHRRSGHVVEKHEIVVTLDPNKFATKKQKRLSIGNHKNYSVHIALDKQLTHGLVRCLTYDRTHRTKVRTHWPYPPDIRAFLYYTTPPERPRIAGELRFRVTSSDDPASFASGSDLLRLNGQPWSRPLYVISKLYPPLYQKLREDRLVPDDFDAILSTFPHKNIVYSRSQLLYTLKDTFIIDFSRAGQDFFVITEEGLETLPFRGPFFDNRDLYGCTPYTGSAMAQFERSTLPGHQDTKTIVLRFLKIITPVRCVMPLYDGYITYPKEGELHKRVSYPTKSDQRVWNVNLDKEKGVMLPGLRLLWNA